MKSILFFLLSLVVISCNILSSKQEPVSVTTPVSKPTAVDPSDSGYLRIKRLTDGYQVSLFQHSLITTEIQAVDRFIQDNRNQLNKNKVVVVGADSLSIVDQLFPILKKYNITKVEINE